MIKKSIVTLSLLATLHTPSFSADVEQQAPKLTWGESFSNACSAVVARTGTPSEMYTTASSWASWAWEGTTSFCAHPFQSFETQKPVLIKALLDYERVAIKVGTTGFFVYAAYYSEVSLLSGIFTPWTAETIATTLFLLPNLAFPGCAGLYVGEQISDPIIAGQKALYPVYAWVSPYVDYTIASVVGHAADKAKERAQKKIDSRKSE